MSSFDGETERTSFWRRSVGRRVLAGVILATVAVAVILFQNYTGGHRSFVRDGCEVPASFEMLNAIKAVRPDHDLHVTAQTEEPFHSDVFLVTETDSTVSINDVTSGTFICTFPAGSS